MGSIDEDAIQVVVGGAGNLNDPVVQQGNLHHGAGAQFLNIDPDALYRERDHARSEEELRQFTLDVLKLQTLRNDKLQAENIQLKASIAEAPVPWVTVSVPNWLTLGGGILIGVAVGIVFLETLRRRFPRTAKN